MGRYSFERGYLELREKVSAIHTNSVFLSLNFTMSIFNEKNASNTGWTVLELRIYVFKNMKHMKWVYIMAFDGSSDGWMAPELLRVKARSFFLWQKKYIYVCL